jgi:hypothetical protein
VVVGEDGDLYELMLGVDLDNPDALNDPVAMRKEELRKLVLHPRDYIVYAYNGLVAVTEALLERSESE